MAVAMAVAIFRIRTAEKKESGIFEDVAKEFYGKDVFSNLPERGYFDVTCQGCVPLALYLAALASDFEDAIRLTVAYGGDTDTLGAIVGSLAEAQFPVPEMMISKAKSFMHAGMLEILTQFDERKK